MSNVREAPDGTFWQVDPKSDDHLGPDPHEAWLEPILKGLVRQGSMFLDVGAHVGRWTVRAAIWGASVVAWEPSKPTYDRLLDNIALNDVERQVDLWQYAAWNREEELTLRPHHDMERNGSASVVSQEEGASETVQGRRVDAFLDLIPNVDVVKVDVEGADAEALEGMLGLLRRDRPDIIWENHAWLYPHKRINDRVANVCEAAGYRTVELRTVESDGVPVPYVLLRPTERT